MPLQYISFNKKFTTPYSDLVIDGDTMYFSGLCSVDMVNGHFITGNITLETRQILTNLRHILEQNNSDMDHVILCNISLADINERQKMNEEYIKHFSPDKLPARYCVGNIGLSDNFRVEMQVVAKQISL